MNKVFLIIVGILAAGLIIFGFLKYSNRVWSDEFSGRVKKIEGSVVTVEGVYLVKDRPDLTGPENLKTVAVKIDDQTKIIKERLFLPTSQETAATGGQYDPSKLKREKIAGSLSDLSAENVSISAKASGNIYGRSSFTASEIIYIEPVFP